MCVGKLTKEKSESTEESGVQFLDVGEDVERFAKSRNKQEMERPNNHLDLKYSQS